MLLHELLNVDQVGCDLAHRLRQVRVVYQVDCLLCQVADVLPTKPTVYYVLVFVHGCHVLLNIVRVSSQSCYVRFEIDWKLLLGTLTFFLSLLSSLATDLFLAEVTARNLGEADEGNGCARLYWLLFFVDSFGDQLEWRRQVDVLELGLLQCLGEVVFVVVIISLSIGLTLLIV